MDATSAEGSPTVTKLLFVCSRNRWRSPTAERLLDGVPGFQVRSAGTEKGARVRVTEGLLGWADVVLCMERRHVERLRARFPGALASKRVVVLDIPDDYGSEGYKFESCRVQVFVVRRFTHGFEVEDGSP